MKPLPPDSLAEDFLRTFALPLVRGGKVHVGAPLGRTGLSRLQTAVQKGLDGTGAAEELSAARYEILSELLFHAEPPRLDGDPFALPILVALHDLLFLLHPAAQGLVFSQQRLHRVAGFAIALCQRAAAALQTLQGPRAHVLAERHSLLHGLFSLSREDVRVSFWAGRRDFLGEDPPARLLAWRNVRRVREERWRVIWYLQMLGLPDGTGRLGIEALLSASPLTDLLWPRRLDPPFDLGKHAPLLRLPPICRTLCHSYLEIGLPEVGGALAGSAIKLLSGSQRPARTDLHTLLCFLSHLHLCTLLPHAEDEPDTPPDKWLPALHTDGTLRDLYGLYGVLEQDHCTLALPADAARSPDFRRLVKSYGEACRRAVGAARIEELSALCARALSPPIPPNALTER